MLKIGNIYEMAIYGKVTSPPSGQSFLTKYNSLKEFERQSIDNPFFDNLTYSVHPKELKLNKANKSDTCTSAAFLDLNLSIGNVKISSKIYDKRDDFNFDIECS